MERLKIYPVLLFLNVFRYKQLDKRILFSTDFEDIFFKKIISSSKKKKRNRVQYTSAEHKSSG